MGEQRILTSAVHPRLSPAPATMFVWRDNRGQSLVEFTLVFIILVIVAWIPADFGLAFYTGQIAQNAVREGARIAAADPSLVAGTTTCTMPACYSAGNNLNDTHIRLTTALLRASVVTVT